MRAGRKFGKTTFAERQAMDALGPPDSVVWSIAPTYKQAKLISWSKYKRIIPPEAWGKKPNDTDLILTLKNGSQLFLMGSDDPDSLRGPEPDFVIFEEVAYHDRRAWHEVIRPNLMPKQSPALFIGTPRGFNWFKELEDEALRLMSLGDPTWAVFHFTVFDNPHISRKEIDEAKRDCGGDERVWRQEYLAEYESSVGRVFSSFSDAFHVQRVELPSGMFQAYRSIDWGMRDDTACLWAFVRNRRLFVYREYAQNNLSAPAQAQVIKNQTTSKEQVVRTAISHDAAKEDPAMKGLTVLWHFRQAGITPLLPSSRDKKHSRSMIQELLQQKRIVIDAEHCPQLRRQLLAYEWKDTSMEKPEDSRDQDLVDALHYLVEMLQFDLFMTRTEERDQTHLELLRAIAVEKLEQQRTLKFAVPSIFQRPEEGLPVEDTPAGYP